ncbi:MAG: DUF3078 domain-containing protein [Bacteroidales bacterium]|nr:DUF3078 domain-containing protein [Candidatus Liminaster caballi]
MKFRIALVYMLSVMVSLPLFATQAVAADQVLSDSIKPQNADSLIADTINAVPLLSSWRGAFPFAETPSVGEVPDSIVAMSDSAVVQLLCSLDSMEFDTSVLYAQNDLRIPVILDGYLPETGASSSSLGLFAQNSLASANVMGLTFSNPYLDKMSFASVRRNAVYGHSLKNLNGVNMFRSGSYDLPTDRKQLDRIELSGGEQVATDMGLLLGSESLDIESVTFHADKWHRRGTSTFQMAHTAFSENWYQGGENNLTISTDNKLVFSRYDEDKITTFDITLDLRLSGYYTKSDTLHPMRVNDNLFRADTKYGYKAWRNWYYSTSVYLTTPLLDFYSANSRTVKSTFLSPLELNVSVGMDLKLTKNKRCQYSLLIAPLSYNLKYVNDHRVNETSYGIDPGHRSKNQFGATVTSKLEWKITDYLSWSNRTYYFTSYHNVQIEFENTFNVAIGRYCSARLYMYPRFDDSRDSEIQTKEMLTFGLSFVW